MMLLRFHRLLLAVLFRPVCSTSFIVAISAYPQLSDFSSLLHDNPAFTTVLLNITSGQTILVPSNSAFTEYQSLSGHSIDELDPATVERILQYHTLNATIKSENLTAGTAAQIGVVVGSQLVDSQYNRRGEWGSSNIKSPGQVVYITAGSDIGNGRRSLGLVARQGISAIVYTGAGAVATIDVIDGIWDGGVFQIVDHFLTLPVNCTVTMNAIGLKNMTSALNSVNKTDTWNSYTGITCLAPKTGVVLNSSLSQVLDAHTIDGPQYISGIQDGQTYKSEANTTITVTVRDGMVWFNDARVVRANVVSNNGVIHVLDKAITPNATAPANSPSPPTSAPKPTTSKSLGTPSVPKSNLGIIIAILSSFIPLFLSIFG